MVAIKIDGKHECMSKIRLGVIFGSRSVEHEVSIITAVQLMKHVDLAKYELVPIYIDKQGRWFTGSQLKQIEAFKDLTFDSQNETFPILATPHGVQSKKLTEVTSMDAMQTIDVAIICCHGTLGEDGTIQGLLELADIPYQGPGVVGSAVGMDKIITKKVLEATGFMVANFQWFTKDEYYANKEKVLASLLDPNTSGHKKLEFPLFVKPANLGSSVGIVKVNRKEELQNAIETALQFDRRILVEQGLTDVIEVNASVLGYEILKASVLEQPIATGELLSYADKYERGGKKSSGMASLHRRIPAPLPMSLTTKIQEAALHIAKTCDLSGVVRIDFFVNQETSQFWVSEVNTIPGSMSFYLWEASGLPYAKLVDELVDIALKRKKTQKNFIRSIQTTIIK